MRAAKKNDKSVGDSRGRSAGLGEIPPGDPTGDVPGEWFDRLYDDLRTRASSYMRQEPGGHTLQTTALVHEAYLRLAAQNSPGWRDRKSFFSATATVMRRLLVDHARARRTQKRTTGAPQLLDEIVSDLERSADDVEELDSALTRLGEIDPVKVGITELRFFVGLSVEETARLLDLSPRTVAREWSFARSWLRGEIRRARGRVPD